MVKLVLCVICGLLLAAVVLQLRQEKLELGYQTAELHDQIRAQQGKLWTQQLLIAACTAPNAIGNTVDTRDLDLVPETPIRAAFNLPAAGRALTPSAGKASAKGRGAAASTGH